MPTYSNSGNFTPVSGQAAYSMYIEARTSQVTGGTLVEAYAEVTMFRNPGTPASGTANRSWSLPGGRDTSTSGAVSTSGSSTLAYAFTSTVPNTIVFYNYFNKYVPYSHGSSTTLTITLDGNSSTFFTSKTLSVAVPLYSNVAPPDAFSATPYGQGTVGNTYSDYVISNNATSITRTGNLPPGLSGAFDAATFRYNVTGTPTTAGVYPFTLTGSNAGGSVTYSASITIIDPEYTVTLRGNGVPDPQALLANSANSFTVSLPTLYWDTNYQFNGWWTAASGGSAKASPYTATSNVTLYAQWIRLTPFFTDVLINLTAKLGVPIANDTNYKVASTPVTAYSVIPYTGVGAGLDPSSWLTVDINGYLVGTPTTYGTYTFNIRATNGANTPITVGPLGDILVTPNNNYYALVVTPPGGIVTSTSSVVVPSKLSQAKLYTGQPNVDGADAFGWKKLTIMKRYNGSQWVPMTNNP